MLNRYTLPVVCFLAPLSEKLSDNKLDDKKKVVENFLNEKMEGTSLPEAVIDAIKKLFVSDFDFKEHFSTSYINNAELADLYTKVFISLNKCLVFSVDENAKIVFSKEID